MTNMTRWLDVEVGTDDIDLDTLPSNLSLVDMHNDNEYRLLMGDLGKGDDGPKLRIFQGVTQVTDMVLPDLPLAVVSIYTNNAQSMGLPVIAVAFSSCIYMYRKMKPFYKYYLPSTELSTCEIEIWKQLIEPVNQNAETIAAYTESLKTIPGKILSPQSQTFLSLTIDQQLDYLEQAKLPSVNIPDITCMTSIKMVSVDRRAAECLIIGTEDGDVIVLESQTFTQLSQAKLCTVKRTPYQMVATGLYNVEYRITVATREKSVCLLKRGSEGRVLFNADDHIVALEVLPGDGSVMVICADSTLACYSKKGKKQWSLNLEHRPVAMTLVPVSPLGLTLTAVALASGHVHLYDGKARRDTIFVRDVASVLMFGQLGQEEHVFIIVTGSGHLMLKILKRTADFNAHAHGVGAEPSPNPGQRPWLIPKKSKLFLEQSARERENAVGMHVTFQHELNRLRLLAAKTLLAAHLKSDNSVGAGALEPARLAAEVEGLGPVFRVTLSIENTSAEKAIVGLSILFHVHTANYKVSQPYIKVPLLAPNSKLRFPTKVEEVFDSELSPDIFFRSVTGQGGERALLKILLLKEGRPGPVLAATVQMPPTDPMMLPYEKIQATADFGA